MSKDKDVTHRGVVERIENGRIVIRTSDAKQCDGCAVVALCGSKSGEGESSELITVDCPDASDFAPGERVAVTASSSSTLLATWWALALPTIVFGGVILASRFLIPGIGAWSIALGFVALALYNLLLYANRNSLAQRIRWKIEKL